VLGVFEPFNRHNCSRQGRGRRQVRLGGTGNEC
jgi:hypothetical protein